MATIVELKCQNCENKENLPVKTYDPWTPGHPDKRVPLCDKCGEANPKAVLDATIADIRAEETEQKEPIEDKIVTPKSKVPKASENKAKDVETKPVDRVDIENKIKQHEEDLNKLLQKRQELRAQHEQVVTMIDAKKGAVAGLRDLLGND